MNEKTVRNVQDVAKYRFTIKNCTTPHFNTFFFRLRTFTLVCYQLKTKQSKVLTKTQSNINMYFVCDGMYQCCVSNDDWSFCARLRSFEPSREARKSCNKQYLLWWNFERLWFCVIRWKHRVYVCCVVRSVLLYLWPPWTTSYLAVVNKHFRRIRVWQRSQWIHVKFFQEGPTFSLLNPKNTPVTCRSCQLFSWPPLWTVSRWFRIILYIFSWFGPYFIS